MTILQSQGFKTLGRCCKYRAANPSAGVCSSQSSSSCSKEILALLSFPAICVTPSNANSGSATGKPVIKFQAAGKSVGRYVQDNVVFPSLDEDLLLYEPQLNKQQNRPRNCSRPPPQIEHLWTSSFIIYDFPCRQWISFKIKSPKHRQKAPGLSPNALLL